MPAETNSARAPQKQAIELLRILSIFGILWFHARAPGGQIAYSGLVTFLLISLYLQARSSNTSRSPFQRTRRLLLPWIVWVFVYGLFNLVRHQPFLDTAQGLTSALLTGTAIHLWYLPFVFGILCLFDLLDRRMNGALLGLLCAFAALISLGTVGLWRNPSLGWGTPYAQYAHALPAVFAGGFLGRSSRLPARIALPLLLGLLGTSAALFGFEGIGIPYFIGLLMAGFVLLFPDPLPPGLRLGALSEVVFGIYLIHLLWLPLLVKAGLSGILLPFGLFIVSALSIFALKKMFPRMSRFVL
jgi:hypothetical protein